MATSFPSGLDALTNPTSSDGLNSPDHAGQHANANDDNAIVILLVNNNDDDDNDSTYRTPITIIGSVNKAKSPTLSK